MSQKAPIDLLKEALARANPDELAGDRRPAQPFTCADSAPHPIIRLGADTLCDHVFVAAELEAKGEPDTPIQVPLSFATSMMVTASMTLIENLTRDTPSPKALATRLLRDMGRTYAEALLQAESMVHARLDAVAKSADADE